MPITSRTGWREQLSNEIHLLVSRVMASDTPDEQIQHGYDFFLRISEDVESLLSQSEARAREEMLEQIDERIRLVSNIAWSTSEATAYQTLVNLRNSLSAPADDGISK